MGRKKSAESVELVVFTVLHKILTHKSVKDVHAVRIPISLLERLGGVNRRAIELLTSNHGGSLGLFQRTKDARIRFRGEWTKEEILYYLQSPPAREDEKLIADRGDGIIHGRFYRP